MPTEIDRHWQYEFATDAEISNSSQQPDPLPLEGFQVVRKPRTAPDQSGLIGVTCPSCQGHFKPSYVGQTCCSRSCGQKHRRSKEVVIPATVDQVRKVIAKLDRQRVTSSQDGPPVADGG